MLIPIKCDISTTILSSVEYMLPLLLRCLQRSFAIKPFRLYDMALFAIMSNSGNECYCPKVLGCTVGVVPCGTCPVNLQAVHSLAATIFLIRVGDRLTHIQVWTSANSCMAVIRDYWLNGKNGLSKITDPHPARKGPCKARTYCTLHPVQVVKQLRTFAITFKLCCASIHVNRASSMIRSGESASALLCRQYQSTICPEFINV